MMNHQHNENPKNPMSIKGFLGFYLLLALFLYQGVHRGPLDILGLRAQTRGEALVYQ